MSTVHIVNSLFLLCSKHDKLIASLHDFNSLRQLKEYVV